MREISMREKGGTEGERVDRAEEEPQPPELRRRCGPSVHSEKKGHINHKQRQHCSCTVGLLTGGINEDGVEG